MEEIFGSRPRPKPITMRPPAPKKDPDFIPIIKPPPRREVEYKPQPIVYGEPPKPVVFKPPKAPKKPKQKKVKKVKEPTTVDYDADRVIDYIKESEDDEFPKSGIKTVLTAYAQKVILLPEFLLYVIRQKKIDRMCLVHFINEQITEPNAVLNTTLLKDICDLIKTVFDSSKIHEMQTMFSMVNPHQETDIRNGLSIHAHEAEPTHVVSMTRMIERKLPGLSEIQKDVVMAMQLAFATCMEIAFHYGAVFVTTDFTVRTAVGFKPIGYGNPMDVDQLALAYKFMHIYRLVIMTMGFEHISLVELHYILSASSSTNEDYFITLPSEQISDMDDDAIATIIRRMVNTISRF
jgi:hypothetical protein